MPALPPPPPAAFAPAAQRLPPLSFLGLRAGMPLAELRSLVRTTGGAFDCKATSDPRMRECNGALVVGGGAESRTFRVLVASIRDSGAVIVLSGLPTGAALERWVDSLTGDFGTPRRQAGPGTQVSWEWIRRGQKLVVVERTDQDGRASSVTLTDGPLLDGLGPSPPNAKGRTERPALRSRAGAHRQPYLPRRADFLADAFAFPIGLDLDLGRCPECGAARQVRLAVR